MIGKIKNRIWLNLKNIPGWKTSRKILVIEADDYGSIRMPSSAAFTALKEKGLSAGGFHDATDTVETYEDLQLLFQVLKSFIDKKGNHAAITPYFNPSNPDFEKIKAGNYQEYFYKNYQQTLEEYGVDKRINNLWKEGVDKGFFKPQFHGREHVNVPFFMKLLQEQNPQIKEAFAFKFAHPTIPGYKNLANLRRAFYFENQDQKDYLQRSLPDGIRLFEENFGYRPTVFCPSNGTFHDDFKPELKKQGIDAVVESGVRFVPSTTGQLETTRKFKIGDYDEKNKLFTYCRNVTFEPTRDGQKGSVSKALREIEAAFRWGKPAIVATHRNNYCGAIDSKNRENGLKALESFLQQIQKKWPEVEFMNSGQLAEIMKKDIVK